MNTTRTLLVIRHAKSSWDFNTVSDFERPLNERGKKDAPAMAARIKSRIPSIDLLVSSPAKRAKKTAAYFAEAFGINPEEIRFISKLYHADVSTFFEVATSLEDTLSTVAIFSHNPGITEFVNELCNVRIDDMPTCGIFAVQVKASGWNEFGSAEKHFLFFDYPKLG